MIPTNNRIKYDETECKWRVLFKGQQTRDLFKTSEEALKHLNELNKGTTQPMYEVSKLMETTTYPDGVAYYQPWDQCFWDLSNIHFF